jgi:hypothetical protein
MQTQELDHWSTPHGCHEDCPACAAERSIPLSSFRRPKIDVNNGEGMIEVHEVSRELLGGDWEDVAYCFNQQEADLALAVMFRLRLGLHLVSMEILPLSNNNNNLGIFLLQHDFLFGDTRKL